MKSFWFEKPFKYDGTQLRSLFGYLEAGILGDSIVAWRGACNVELGQMIDGEDFREKQKICGSDMVHFIIESFPANLPFAVAMQRLLSSTVKDLLSEMAPGHAPSLIREGDDIYLKVGKSGEISRQKMSISIATVSPVSGMIHFAINVANKGTPVPTAALEDLQINPEEFAREALKRFSIEYSSIMDATKKVFSVHEYKK